MVINRRPRLITFDVFGTIFRLDELASLGVMERIITANSLSMSPEELGQLWWDKSYRVAHDTFMTVRRATREALSLILQEVGAPDDPEPYTDLLLEIWAEADAYPEAIGAIHALEDFTLGIISNIDDDLLDVLLSRFSFKDAFEVRATSETCRTYKPDQGIFQEALRKANCTPKEALHLGDTPVDDILGPKRVGMMAGWINRRGERLKGRIPEPDMVVRDLREAAQLILRT